MLDKNIDYIIIDTNIIANTISPKHVSNMLTWGGALLRQYSHNFLYILSLYKHKVFSVFNTKLLYAFLH